MLDSRLHATSWLGSELPAPVNHVVTKTEDLRQYDPLLGRRSDVFSHSVVTSLE